MVGSQLTRGEREHRPRLDTPHRVDGKHARELRLAGAFNVRDLGHLPVRGRRVTRCGRLYRADSLDWLTADDRGRLFDERRIGTVIDLRTHAEAGGDGRSDARLFPEVRTLCIPLIPDDQMQLQPFPVGDPSAVAGHYLGYLDGGGEARQILDAIAASLDAEAPVLFHCAAGRDRTGVVAALVLLIVGATKQAVVADYLESNRQARRLTLRLTRNPMYRQHERFVATVTKVDRRAIIRFMELLEARYGGAREWARAVGVSDQTIHILTTNLVVG